MVPSAGVTVVLLTNGGGARELYAALFRELLAELAGVTMPAPFAPPTEPPVVFSPLRDGTGCVSIGMRCGPKVAQPCRGVGEPPVVCDDFTLAGRSSGPIREDAS
ncbi:hypothetical protein AB0H82_21665 [Streptomyces sp. NPDC050732]|uniref:hypothetical protein n=1 Tax=Streptomyces sp. NPDC050732 TaxID=3154632 RepID=UPI003440DB0C